MLSHLVCICSYGKLIHVASNKNYQHSGSRMENWDVEAKGQEQLSKADSQQGDTGRTQNNRSPPFGSHVLLYAYSELICGAEEEFPGVSSIRTKWEALFWGGSRGSLGYCDNPQKVYCLLACSRIYLRDKENQVTTFQVEMDVYYVWVSRRHVTSILHFISMTFSWVPCAVHEFSGAFNSLFIIFHPCTSRWEATNSVFLCVVTVL